ncbi:hypothetical protein J4N45_10910 [Vibrio sp. SCSIO 43140]|uniref:hypothetical protein n=1 Tax=Vibrio sp. SCSIO 43140 TaxID=2819100 RepID=UPI002074F71C|nr:hypothetical protein [Vibrio sp. SCSIO 43140]USD59040.1 hypothetical protein J4N45_10910 [Vibrio sp. SCSIO 43140]
MEILFDEMLAHVYNHYPFLAAIPLKPLALGSGTVIAACLVNHYKQAEIDEFIQYFFSRREYKLALINTHNADPTRYDVHGFPTSGVVNQNEILGLARHGMFKRTNGLLPPAKKLVKTQQKYVIKRHKLLKRKVYKLKSYGFSDEFILSRLGNRTEPILKLYKSVKPTLKNGDLKEAKLMQQQTIHLSKKELKVFQRKLFREGFPVPLILTASNHYEPLLFELILPELSSSKLASA